ncbi:MAG TPA: radical SAM family heme chaperone HemW [Acidimicrobiales bacterium]
MAKPGVEAPAFGVYVHIPFCASRCDYCAFATWTDRAHLIGDYLDAVVVEAGRELAASPDRDALWADSVFFGGGTPSLVPAAGLVDVLAAIPRHPDAEVTVECNPDTVTAELLETYRAGGVNRLSFGVQSMVDHVLVALGRTHDVANVERAVTLARAAGFESINLDLIYGGVGETLDDWRVTLERVIRLDIPHVSAYALTIEAGTPLAADPQRHPDDDDQADKYLLAVELLGAAGLESYEISNWARPGFTCRHNQLYWRQGDYVGLGCAAHSHRSGRRWWNVRTPDRYLELVGAGRSPEGGFEELDAAARRIEGLQLALRTREGVPLGVLPDDDPALDGLVETAGERQHLTVAGRLLANEVALRLS